MTGKVLLCLLLAFCATQGYQPNSFEDEYAPAWGEIISKILDRIKEVLEGIIKNVNEVWENIQKEIAGLVGRIKDLLEKWAEAQQVAKEIITKCWNDVQPGLQNLVQEAKDDVKKCQAEVQPDVDNMKTLEETCIKDGKDLVAKLPSRWRECRWCVLGDIKAYGQEVATDTSQVIQLGKHAVDVGRKCVLASGEEIKDKAEGLINQFKECCKNGGPQ